MALKGSFLLNTETKTREGLKELLQTHVIW